MVLRCRALDLHHGKHPFAPVWVTGTPSRSAGAYLAVQKCRQGSGWGNRHLPRGRAPLRPLGNGACRKVLPGSCPTLQPRAGAGGMGGIWQVGRTVGFTRFIQGCAYEGWTGKGLNTAGSPGALQKGFRNESVPAPTRLVCCIPRCRVLLQHGAPRDWRPQPESSRQGQRKAFSSWRGKAAFIVISVTACVASGCIYSRRRSKRSGRGKARPGTLGKDEASQPRSWRHLPMPGWR